MNLGLLVFLAVLVSTRGFYIVPRLGVAGRKQFTGKLEMLVEEERSSLVPKSSSVEPPSSALSSLQGGSAQLKNLLESMPLEEKYSLLLQNYASSIMEQSAKDSDSVIKTMRSLYSEMLSLSVTPTEKSSRAMLNAAAVLCSSDTLGQVLQLVKASGALRAFGVANGQLTKPTVSALGSLLNKVEIPYDDREIEVFYASLVAGTTTLYFSLQLAGHTFFQDAQPWATLCGLLALIVSGADIGIRGGKGLKYAAAGIDRLVLRDAERENHCESAAFLTGYLLGLPCYCFQPDVNEALKLLRDAPGGLDVYKQRLARIKGSQGSKGGVSTISISSSKSTRRNLFGLPSALTSSTSKSSGVDRGSGAMESLLQSNSLAAGLKAEQADAELEKQRDILGKALLDFESKQESDIFGLGRVLVWMMAPVAAEEMKYGKSLLSDPKRAKRLLEVLDSVQQTEQREANMSNNANANANAEGAIKVKGHISLPIKAEDKEALLQWAYFEAQSLVRQYADLLEDVQDYLGSGTSSVGECTALLEQEMTA